VVPGAGASDPLVASRGLVFAEAMIFIALLGVGFVYAWRKGIFRWR
jgi:NADH:ubiquinone oxidoreductase subunit 3 (subunit A)